MPPHLAALLLQSAEATKLVGVAGLEATKAAAHEGSSIPWFLFLLSLAALAILAVLFYREQKSKNADIQAAVATALGQASKDSNERLERFKEMSAQLVQQLERHNKELNEALVSGQRTLQEANKDLRQTERDSIEVLSATGSKIRELSTAISQVVVNHQELINNQAKMILLLNQLTSGVGRSSSALP